MRPVMIALSLSLAVPALPGAAQTPSPRPDARVAVSQAAQVSPRPALRPATTPETVQRASLGPAGFNDWVQDFARRAQRQGIPFEVVRNALTGIRYDDRIVALDRNQAEFSKQLWEYLDSAVSANRISTGRSMVARHGATLDRIEGRYGVEKETVVAIWGLESAYGGYKGNTDTISALATLAYDGRRGDFFEDELMAALQIVADGDTAPRAMRGSWAGAMGHTQFMPSSYLAHAVDFTGDGRRDIWGDDPTDALASTAAYLRGFGWTKGQPWGVEVRLPQGFDYALAGAGEKSVAAWSRLGVRGADGSALPNHGQARLLLPAGANGPAFLTFANFDVIKRYNASTSYALAVGHLGDRIGGAGDFRQSWPRGDRALSADEKRDLQRRLTARGFSTNGIDGKVGPDTIAAIRRYQQAAGLVPDGYASVALLNRLR
jgi:membrane-bound lytic murein transglycosylase B